MRVGQVHSMQFTGSGVRPQRAFCTIVGAAGTDAAKRDTKFRF